jgi:flagellar basal-body rod protein FlgF
MDRGLYVAMTGAKQIMQAQAVNNHNIANVSTTGFRADAVSFTSEPIYGPGYATRVNAVRSTSPSTARVSSRFRERMARRLIRAPATCG